MKPKKPIKFQSIGLIGRTKLEKDANFLEKLKNHLQRKGCSLMWDSHVGAILGKKNEHSVGHILRNVDMAITLGGDGTILKLVRDLPTRKNLLVFGVNLGNLGFHTAANRGDAFKLLDEFFQGNYHVDERLLLRVTIYRNGKKIDTNLALNDVVVNQGSFARLISLKAEVDQRKMLDFKADGVIVATPSGSTAHALSAGGPILHPRVDALVFAPICPSILSLRPIVIPSNRQITLTVDTDRRYQNNYIGLTVDGQVVIPLEYGDQIKLRASHRKLRFIRKQIVGGRYYRLLREKLNWGI